MVGERPDHDETALRQPRRCRSSSAGSPGSRGCRPPTTRDPSAARCRASWRAPSALVRRGDPDEEVVAGLADVAAVDRAGRLDAARGRESAARGRVSIAATSPSRDGAPGRVRIRAARRQHGRVLDEGRVRKPRIGAAAASSSSPQRSRASQYRPRAARGPSRRPGRRDRRWSSPSAKLSAGGRTIARRNTVDPG